MSRGACTGHNVRVYFAMPIFIRGRLNWTTAQSIESVPLTGLTYSVRPNLFSGPQTYELQSDALVVRKGAKTRRVPYGDIKSLRLIDYANFGGRQRQCTLKTDAHGKLKVRSHHYVSLGNFENRSTTFDPFIRELCGCIRTANPDAEFVRGSGSLQIVWSIVLACAVFGWIGWVAAAVEKPSELSDLIGGAAILGIATLLGLQAFAGNKVEQFDPSNPPLR